LNRSERFKEFRADPVLFLKIHPEVLLIPLLFFAVIGVWELIVRFYDIAIYILPPPSKIFIALYKGVKSGVILTHFKYTFLEIMLGFVIGSVIGIILGALIAQFRILENTLYPYLIAFQAVPKIAIAPLLILWLGFGISSKVALSVMVAFFPVLVNTIAGLDSVERNRIDLMRSLSATRWQIFRMVKLPTALPYIFAGLEIGLMFSVLATIVGEFVGSQNGLGNLILQMNFSLDVPGVFSILIVLALLGLTLNILIRAVSKKLIFWGGMEK
jgi:NitT/TauT family transport system permease protein